MPGRNRESQPCQSAPVISREHHARHTALVRLITQANEAFMPRFLEFDHLGA